MVHQAKVKKKKKNIYWFNHLTLFLFLLYGEYINKISLGSGPLVGQIKQFQYIPFLGFKQNVMGSFLYFAILCKKKPQVIDHLIV